MKKLPPHLDLDLDDRPGEEWRDVVGYDGRYLVSTMGRIKSYPQIRTFKGTEYIKKSIIRKQYEAKQKGRPSQSVEYTVTLYDGLKHKTFTVVQLVATAFLRPRAEGEFVLHRNKKQYDNRLSNLIIGTAADLYDLNLRAGLPKLKPGHPKLVLNQRGVWEGDKLVSIICIKCNQTKPVDQFRVSQSQYTCQKCKHQRVLELKRTRAIYAESSNQSLP